VPDGGSSDDEIDHAFAGVRPEVVGPEVDDDLEYGVLARLAKKKTKKERKASESAYAKKRARNSTSASSAAMLLPTISLTTLDMAEGVHELVIGSNGVVVSNGDVDFHVQVNYLVAMTITILCLLVGICASCCWCCPRRCGAALWVLVFGVNNQSGSRHKGEDHKKVARRHAMVQAPVHYNGQRYVCAGNDFTRGMGASCETFAAD